MERSIITIVRSRCSTWLLMKGLLFVAIVLSLAFPASYKSYASSRPSSAQSKALNWSSPKTVGPDEMKDYLADNSLACPSPSFCVAVFGGDYAVTFIDGSWSKPRVIDAGKGQGLYSVSCASPSFCVAADYERRGAFYNGRAWSAPRLLGSGFVSYSLSAEPIIDCPSSSFCLVTVNGLGGTSGILAYHDGLWSGMEEPGINPLSISCVSSSFCRAVDSQGSVLSYSDGSWTSPTTIDYRGYLESISCVAKSFCVAVDTYGYDVVYRGQGWSSPELIDPSQGLSSVSCASPSFCEAVDDHGNALTYDGSLWSKPRAIDKASLASVACPKVGYCVATDYIGRVLVGRL